MRLKDIGRSEFANPTFLISSGLDPFVMNMATSRIASKFNAKARRLSLKVSSLDEVIDLIHTGDLFSGRNLYIIEDLESIKKSKLKDLAHYLRDLPKENLALILIKDRSKIPDQVLKTGKTIRISVDIEEDIVPWIKSYFGKAGIEIDRKTIDYLVDLYQDHLETLERELEKIRYYFYEKKKVTLDRLMSILSDTPVVNAIRFSEGVIQQDKKEALNQIERMKEWDVNVQLIIGTMTGYFFRVLDKAYANAPVVRKLKQLAKLDLVTKSKTQLPWYHLELYTITH